jgi:hypothetical protein
VLFDQGMRAGLEDIKRTELGAVWATLSPPAWKLFSTNGSGTKFGISLKLESSSRCKSASVIELSTGGGHSSGSRLKACSETG